MKIVLTTAEIARSDPSRVGGKAYALARMKARGVAVPRTVCVTCDAYDAFVSGSGIRERIMLELHRKDFTQMRWEEIWDCATRIRNIFLKTPMPASLERTLTDAVARHFSREGPLAVRSSAPEEDNVQASFAGLHDSFLNLRGPAQVIEHVRKVWASLWSDAALLYRQEIGLDASRSAMAVVIQEIVSGERSGVAFSQSPMQPSQGVVEAVWGLNQGLVDGAIEPDRWILDRATRTILDHTPVARTRRIVPTAGGVSIGPLPETLAGRAPLDDPQVVAVFNAARAMETLFERPQDVEWTLRKRSLFILQSRPVTTAAAPRQGDNRAWYLSLHRSFENLGRLRRRIEDDLIPGMIDAAERLAAIDLDALNAAELAAEIRRRLDVNTHWVNVYWEEFIPFAHGVRLFGQVYNDAVRPDDPYEFVDLLTDTDMASLQRNRMLEDLAAQVRRDPALAERLRSGRTAALDTDFAAAVDAFVVRYGDLSCAVTGGTACLADAAPLFAILLQMAGQPPLSPVRRKSGRSAELKARFLARVPESEHAQAVAMLDLARASYRLRDDDNIYLGRIEAQVLRAVQAGRERIAKRDASTASSADDDLLKVLAAHDHPGAPAPSAPADRGTGSGSLKPRQLTGQPAGPGLARATARVVHGHADLAAFAAGEVLVCDSVDPNMTFVIPLAAAVVERRGGMLIHGAIIAREYGLPCVTGITDATTLIRTGDPVTVDGYLGIVTVGMGEIT